MKTTSAKPFPSILGGWLWAGLLLGLACGPAARDPAGPCAAYAGTSTEGFCLARAAGSAATPDSLDAYCARAGEWAPDCRHAFVRARLREGAREGAPERDALLAWCGGVPDCALEVLELRAAPSWPEQRALCLAWAGPFTTDCLTHALGRWATGPLAAGDVAQIAEDYAPDATLVGQWMGAVVACRAIGACPSAGPTAAACAEGQATMTAEPDRCPRAPSGPVGAAPPR